MCFWLSGGEREGTYWFPLFCLPRELEGPFLVDASALLWSSVPVALACMYLIYSEEKKKSFFILYSIFIPAWLSSPAACSSCLLQAVGGQAGTNHESRGALPSPSAACPCKSPREGESLCEHTAVTGNICSSQRISRSSNFCKAAEGLGEWE